MEKELITSHDDLVKFVKDGHFFNFSVAFALNKGYRDAIKQKQEIKFTVGDYDVTFDPKQMCFLLANRVYIFRIITAYYQEVMFIGMSEEEVINDLLTELEKEKP